MSISHERIALVSAASKTNKHDATSARVTSVQREEAQV